MWCCTVSEFSPDVTPPKIQAFSLYHDARLVVYISEPIQVASFDVTGLQLQVCPLMRQGFRALSSDLT